jgi:hypothetical protein
MITPLFPLSSHTSPSRYFLASSLFLSCCSASNIFVHLVSFCALRRLFVPMLLKKSYACERSVTMISNRTGQEKEEILSNPFIKELEPGTHYEGTCEKTGTSP